jgi:TatD DNase family protein
MLARLEGLARAGVVALGECGLDYSKGSQVSKEVQQGVFLTQLNLALRLNLPLIIHAREAEEDCYMVLEAAGVPADWPIHRHCFNDSWAAALKWLRAFPASKIGLTNLVTFPRAAQAREVARRVPLSRLLLETDAPYFQPRGSLVMMEAGVTVRDFSQPGHVLQAAATVAKIKGRPLEQVLRANLRNVTEIYGIKTSYNKEVAETEAKKIIM